MITPITTSYITFMPVFRSKSSGIERLTKENFREVYPLYQKYRQSAGVKSSIKEIGDYLTAESRRCEDEIFISKKDNKPIGFLQCGKEYSTLRPDFRYRIKAMFVDAAFRGKGIAKKLIQAMQDFAGEKEVVVKAKRANKNSPEVYRSTDFHEDSEYFHFVYKKSKL